MHNHMSSFGTLISRIHFRRYVTTYTITAESLDFFFGESQAKARREAKEEKNKKTHHSRFLLKKKRMNTIFMNFYIFSVFQTFALYAEPNSLLLLFAFNILQDDGKMEKNFPWGDENNVKVGSVELMRFKNKKKKQRNLNFPWNGTIVESKNILLDYIRGRKAS